MARTFGGTTGSRVVFSSINSFGASLRAMLIAGWFYPTTLTAGRPYWALGAGAWRAEIGATTSEIVLRTNNATTAGVYTSTGAGITANTWNFIAFYIDCVNSGQSGIATSSIWYDLWVGTETTAPNKIGYTTTTQPVGNFTGSTTIIVGNQAATGTTPFIGDIGNIYMALQSNATNTAVAGPLFCAANYQYPRNNQETLDGNTFNPIAYRNFILPYWRGNPFPDAGFDNSYNGDWAMYAIPMDSAVATIDEIRVISVEATSVFDRPMAAGANAAPFSTRRSPYGKTLDTQRVREFIPNLF